MNFVHQEMQLFQDIVPLDDEVAMVLKAHLLLERSLWQFVAVRIGDEDLLKDLQSENSGVKGGKALIQLAQALGSRDEHPIDNAEKLWPALHELNSLRNKVAHSLEPDRRKVSKHMRHIVKVVLGENTNDLQRDFYHAAWLLLGYMGIARQPAEDD